MKRKRIVLLSIVIIAFALSLAFAVNVLFKIHSNGVFSAEWDAGDALNYVAVIAGTIGTVILGYIAYWQNEMLMRQNNKLRDLEESNYIANNNSMIVIEEIKIEEQARIPVNFAIYAEQIVVDTDTIKKYVGYNFVITAKRINEHIPVLVYIENCILFCVENKSKTVITSVEARNWCNKFSRIAICKEKMIKFEMKFVIDREKKEEFEAALKNPSCDLEVDIMFQIVANKNVVTKCKCISCMNKEQMEKEIIWTTKNPMVFYYGNFVIKDYEIAGESE